MTTDTRRFGGSAAGWAVHRAGRWFTDIFGSAFAFDLVIDESYVCCSGAGTEELVLRKNEPIADYAGMSCVVAPLCIFEAPDGSTRVLQRSAVLWRRADQEQVRRATRELGLPAMPTHLSPQPHWRQGAMRLLVKDVLALSRSMRAR